MYQNKKQKQKGGNIKERKWESKHKIEMKVTK